MTLYEKVSAKIYSIYLRYIAICDIHVYSIDEVFIEATHYMTMYKEAAEVAGMETPHFLAMTMVRDVLKNNTSSGDVISSRLMSDLSRDIMVWQSNRRQDI